MEEHKKTFDWFFFVPRGHRCLHQIFLEGVIPKISREGGWFWNGIFDYSDFKIDDVFPDWPQKTIAKSNNFFSFQNWQAEKGPQLGEKP